jgi:ABC-type glycerol-3-phosphate transport system substrate-binding protein
MDRKQGIAKNGTPRFVRNFLRVLALELALISLASPAVATQKRTLEIWHHTTTIYDRAMSLLEQGFEALHPHIDVVTVPTEKIEEKAVLALLGGSPPHVVQLQIGDATQPGLVGMFSPLPPALVHNVHQTILNPMREIVTRQGNVYGIPSNISIAAAPILTIDTDAWAAAGLSTELHSLGSWGEMLTAFRHLTISNAAGVITRPGVSGFIAYPEELFSAFVLWYEGALYAQDGRTPLFASGEGNSALSTMVEL